MKSSHLVLATLPTADESERLLVTVSPEDAGKLMLVQQSWSDSIGWFTQKSMEIALEQVAELRNALGWSASAARQHQSRKSERSLSVAGGRTASDRRSTASAVSLRLVGAPLTAEAAGHAESA